MRAEILSHANTSLGKISLWSAVGKSVMPRCAALPCVSEYFLELAKGFEPLTL
jgi:hypothetical protein